MSLSARILTVFFAILAVSAQLNVARADAGDVLAGLIGGVVALIAICALLGWWSRRGEAGGSSAPATGSSEGGESTT